MNTVEFQQPIRAFFAKRRFRDFASEYKTCATILDIGGEPSTWRVIGCPEKVTILNIVRPRDSENFKYVQGSACDLPLEDQSFDLAFSNSVIEHLGSVEN